MEERPDILESEIRLGFAEQTLTYPADFELPLIGERGVLRERVVALTLDDVSRFKRRSGGGYVLEQLAGERWVVAEAFDTLAAVSQSAAFCRHRRVHESALQCAEGAEDEARFDFD